MGILTDMLAGLPINALQRQKLEDQEKRLAALEQENKVLRERLAGYEAESGEKCPMCRKPFLSLKSAKPNAIFGNTGLGDYLFSCSGCGFEDTVSADSAGKAWATVRG